MPLDRSFVFIDTETATLHGAPHLLELAAVRVEDGEIVDTFDMLVRPQVPIEPGATAIHGIGDEDVRNAPATTEVLERFTQWLGDDWLVAHNARFDAGVLAFEYTRNRLPMPGGMWLDTVKLARRLIVEAPDCKLHTLCQILDIEVDVFHRALPDAVSCWRVFEACIDRLREARAVQSQSSEESATDSSSPALVSKASLLSELLQVCGGTLTIASIAPCVPRLAPRLRSLERACKTGGRVTLVYGATNETSHLPVSPRLLFERERKGYLEAECMRSGLLKTYRLDRVQRVHE